MTSTTLIISTIPLHPTTHHNPHHLHNPHTPTTPQNSPQPPNNPNLITTNLSFSVEPVVQSTVTKDEPASVKPGNRTALAPLDLNKVRFFFSSLQLPLQTFLPIVGQPDRTVSLVWDNPNKGLTDFVKPLCLRQSTGDWIPYIVGRFVSFRFRRDLYFSPNIQLFRDRIRLGFLEMSSILTQVVEIYTFPRIFKCPGIVIDADL